MIKERVELFCLIVMFDIAIQTIALQLFGMYMVITGGFY